MSFRTCRGGSGNSEKEKETHFLSENHRFYRSQEEFKKIQGTPYTSYWASDVIMNAFANSKLVGDISDPRVGMATANNDRFVRLWHEIECCKFGIGIPSRQSAVDSRLKWFPFAKGGEQRKWYGNNDTVVNWENDGFEIQNFKDEKTGRIRSHNYNLDYIFSSVGLSKMCYTLGKANKTCLGERQERGRMGKLL